ncbi:hypothetical protein ACLOJK_025199 [Asimina triloba]
MILSSPSFSARVAFLSCERQQPPLFTHVCDPARYAELGLDISALAFCNNSLPFPARARDLIVRMTLEEKVAQIGNAAKGVARLGIPPYNWWSEILHGVSTVGGGSHFSDEVPGATSFPTPILTTASFNETLWKTIGEVVSTEARAMHNLGLAGLTFWSPTMNIARDPRWGRVMETPGEDPFVVGTYATAFVRGLQDVKGKESGDLNSRPLKVSACCKHYTAYDIDEWLGVQRWSYNSKVTEQDMVETFNRPFEMCVKEGDVSSVMCSYNRIDGIPSCADARLLSGTIRGEWNLHGYIVSDCDSIEVIHHGHKWLHDTPEEAVRQVLRAGMDLDCGVYYQNYTVSSVLEGLSRESDVDKALTNLYIVLMRLGYFDGSPEYASLGKADVCSEEHKELAAEAAREGIVLLKNTGNALPLSQQNITTLAVVGPHANATDAMQANYAGPPCRFIRPIDGLAEFAEVNFQRGCADVACHGDDYIFHAMRAAQESDATVVFVGLDLSIEQEGKDRVDLLLPGYQSQLINQVAQVSKGPVIVVVFSAGPVDISFAKTNAKVSAILWAGYPGEEGGRAVADVIFGKYNPGGRLPVTWYPNDYINQLPMTSMKFRPDDALGYPGRTYKFYNGSTVYPFGYGLSYTNFCIRLVSAVRTIKTELGPLQHCQQMQYEPGAYIPPCHAVKVDDLQCQDTIDFEVEVENAGDMDGSHVLLVYSIPPQGYVGAPSKQVVDFLRVFVEAGCSATVSFSVNACKALSMVTESAYVVLPWGTHTISVGDGEEAVTFPIHVNYEFSV